MFIGAGGVPLPEARMQPALPFQSILIKMPRGVISRRRRNSEDTAAARGRISAAHERDSQVDLRALAEIALKRDLDAVLLGNP